MNKKVAIMQPYIFPYIGYFQLINSVDEFVIYDNIKYTKKGWINRNRLLLNRKDTKFSIPLRKGSDFLHVRERFLSEKWNEEKVKLITQLNQSYSKSPYFKPTIELMTDCLNTEEKNLFEFIYEILQKVNSYLGIETKITVSSTLDIDHNLKSQDKVISICQNRKSKTYINPIGGLEAGLYSVDEFSKNGLELKFLKSDPIVYKQFDGDFVPWLSIVDVLMFNSKDEIKKFLNSYTLI